MFVSHYFQFLELLPSVGLVYVFVCLLYASEPFVLEGEWINFY